MTYHKCKYKDEGKLTKLFNQHFNLEYHKAFNKQWISIIGEPYTAEEFEKCLRLFVLETNMEMTKVPSSWNKKFIKKPTKVTFRRLDGSKITFLAVRITRRKKK